MGTHADRLTEPKTISLTWVTPPSTHLHVRHVVSACTGARLRQEMTIGEIWKRRRSPPPMQRGAEQAQASCGYYEPKVGSE
jgi:hypothetical protein